MFKKLLIFFVVIVSISLCVFVNPSQAATVKNYIWWEPKRISKWAYTDKYGGMSFMNYQRQTDFAKLKKEFNDMISIHKPDLIFALAGWGDLQPLKFINGSPVLPEANRTLDQVRDDELKFDYFDDLIRLAHANNIEVIFYLTGTPYGGPTPYPFTYYSKTGWFWKRPDWDEGIASPHSEAMRHPNSHQISSDYNWCEHETGYVKVDCTKRHWSLTTDNIEDTGVGIWPVFESPDFVFNGSSLALHYDPTKPNNLPFPLHFPIPSYSSQSFRQITRDLFVKIGNHYKDKNLFGYYLFMEPSYAHLREQMTYINGYTGDTQSGDGGMYEVDYSPAELSAYNKWRASKEVPEPALDKVPYPPTNNYKTFREYNLADFLNNLKQGLLESDPQARVVLSYFEESSIIGEASDLKTQLEVIDPEIISFDPPLESKKVFENNSQLNNFVDTLKNYSQKADTFISTYIEPNTSIDISVSNLINFDNFYAPALYAQSLHESYPLWDSSKCAGCIFRYQTPGTPAQVDPPSACTPIGNNTTIDDLINWYQAYRGAPNQDSDLNCDTKINIDDLVFWYQKYRS